MFLSLLAASVIAEPTVLRDIVFTRPEGVDVKMDIWQPADKAAAHPAVVVIHGGGWSMGDKGQMDEMAKAFARNGLVAANINYRLAPKSKWPAMIDDAQTAVRFVRANATKYSIDPKKVGAAGASAGGHLSLLLGFTDTLSKPSEHPKESSKVKAVLNFFGPTDFQVDFAPNMRIVLGGLFRDKDHLTDNLKNASPVTYLDKGDACVFTFHGDKDPLVPIHQAYELQEKLKAVGIDNDLVVIKGGSHGIDMRREDVKAALAKMLDWFKRKLG